MNGKSDTDVEVKKKSLLKTWCDFLNADLSKHLATNKITNLPECFGHMHSKSRWINKTSTEDELKLNAKKVSQCYVCPHDNKCFKRTMASYTFQILNTMSG